MRSRKFGESLTFGGGGGHFSPPPPPHPLVMCHLQNTFTKPLELGSWYFYRMSISPNLSHVMCHVSHVMCPKSWVICHMSSSKLFFGQTVSPFVLWRLLEDDIWHKTHDTGLMPPYFWQETYDTWQVGESVPSVKISTPPLWQFGHEGILKMTFDTWLVTRDLCHVTKYTWLPSCNGLAVKVVWRWHMTSDI